MRTDKSLDENVLTSKDWNDDKPDEHLLYNVYETIEENGQKRLIMHSLSGWERNHTFLNTGTEFEDVSLISGMDSESDTRAHCTLDLNRDGYSDVALVNSNNPHLQVFLNQLRELSPEPNHFVAIRLVGGNATDRPSTQWSSRDGVGTLVEVKTNDRSCVRELRFGEGFGAQNSLTLIFGTGQDSEVDVHARWLSGKSQELKNLAVGKLITIFENPAESADGSGANIQDYRPANTIVVARQDEPATQEFAVFDEQKRGKYQLVTSMATWCVACKTNASQLEIIKEHFGDQLGLYGLPMDPQDSLDKLNRYIQSQKPAYDLVTGATPDQRTAFEEVIHSSLGKVALPSTLLVDGDGTVVKTWAGVPSVSEVAQIVDQD